MKNKRMPFCGLVCARKGSKRLENKNSLPIMGTPLYEVAALKLANEIEDVYLLTDIPEALESFLERPYAVVERPKELNSDDVPLQDVIDWFADKENLHDKYENIVLLMPTNPMIEQEHISKAMINHRVFNRNITRSYSKSGNENGLYIMSIDYVQNNSFLYDVHTGCEILPGIEIHTISEYDVIREMIEKKAR